MARRAEVEELSAGEQHKVSLCVAFSLSVNKPQKEPYSFEAVRDGESKRVYENLSPEHYFRIQYQLLPSGGNRSAHVFKTDVVNFSGVVTKIYTDKFSRVLQSWPDTKEEGHSSPNKTNTFSWRHKHRFMVDKAALLRLHGHTVEVRLWSSVKKVSTSTRYDRPKAFKLPSQPLSLELLKQPVQYALVSHDPAKALPKMSKSFKRSNSYPAVTSEDSGEPLSSTAASTQATTTSTMLRTTSGTAISQDRPTSSNKTSATHNTSHSSEAPSLSPVVSPTRKDSASKDITRVFSVISEHAGVLLDEKTPHTTDEGLEERDSSDQTEDPPTATERSDKDNNIDHIDAVDDSKDSPDHIKFHTSQSRQKSVPAHSRRARGRGRSHLSRSETLSHIKCPNSLVHSQDTGKRQLDQHDRTEGLPSAMTDSRLAMDASEPGRASYSDTSPSQITAVRSRSFMDRGRAPIIKVLLDPDLFPPMTIPSLKCHRRDYVYLPAFHSSSPTRPILPRRSQSLPTSPNRRRRYPLFQEGVNQQIDVVVDSASPSHSNISSRLPSGLAVPFRKHFRSHSVSPTGRSLKKITRELSKILARSIHLSQQEGDGEDDASYQPLPSPTIVVTPTKSSAHAQFPDERISSPARKYVEQKCVMQNKDSKPAGAGAHKQEPGPTGSQKQAKGARGDQPEVSSFDAKEQARINREGLVVLRLRLSELFSTKGFVRARLESPIKDVMGFEVGVHLTTPLMPEHLVRELRPMAVTVEKVTALPANPTSYQDLAQKCEPAYVQYQFPLHSPLRTQGLPHAPQLSFHSSNVLLLGTLDDAKFLEFLRGPPLTFELHDRDPQKAQTVTHAIFGQDSMDEVIGTHMFGASLADGDASKASNKPSCPHGIAKFDLSGFLRGGCWLQQTIPVLPSPRSSPYRLPLGVAAVPPGNYIDTGCEMTVTFEIWRPLNVLIPGSLSWKTADTDRLSKPSFQLSATTSTSPSTSPLHKSPSRLSLKKKLSFKEEVSDTACPFNRLVYIISTAEGTDLLDKVLAKVNAINAASLGLDHLPGNILHAALSTYKLTREQLADSDIITGFHVDDFGMHTLVLEGLKDVGIQSLWETCPRHHSQDPALLKVFYNSKFEFSKRLYGSLDVDLPKITLSRPLKDIMLQPFIYLQGSIPKSCLRALTCLNWLQLVDDMLGITKNNLFPSTEEVASLSLHFSLPAELPPTAVIVDRGKDVQSQSQGGGTKEGKVSLAMRPMTPNVVSSGHQKRVWTPLEIDNPEFVASLRQREKQKKDFLHSNIHHCEMLSEVSRHRNIERYGHARSNTVPLTHTLTLPPLTGTTHNYSSHTYNSSGRRLEEMRQSLDPRKRYTFCQDYFHRTISPVKCERLDKVVRRPQRSRWLTEEGFIYPGVPSARQSNKHARKPTPSRLEDLAKPFQDNLLHWNKLLPTVDRMHFSAADRKRDFDLWTGPPVDPTDPPYVMRWTLEPMTAQEREEMRQRERTEWEKRVVVEDSRFYTHRSNTRTELSNKAPTKLDALRTMLKDPPMKKSLRESYPSDIPPLSVVQYPQLDPHLDMITLGQDKEPPLGGYHPGPFESKSLKLGYNHIPCLGRGEEKEIKENETQSMLLNKDSVKMYWSAVDSKNTVPASPEERAQRRHRTKSVDNMCFPFHPALLEVTGQSPH